ncbi:transposable element Tcb2 transposase [Trichonephila clavipes]|uniref:Transposable element Tcb2 transposase n=1 Tax=Trichonephila clavipes TaxID=2585209 RepID=A0A8X6VY85_TRICX|nr:transposable element Tcb2 transposase [Trichonephila clavipes]
MLFCYPHGNGVFQQNNCNSHKSRFATGWLDEHSFDLSVINWPPRSPDLNTIEHLYDVLEQGSKDHPTAPTSLTELWTALANIWQVIPVERFQKLVESMSRRMAAVIKIKTLSQRSKHSQQTGLIDFRELFTPYFAPNLCKSYKTAGPAKRSHRASCPETSEAFSTTLYHHDQFDLSNVVGDVPQVLMEMRRSSILLEKEILGIFFKLWHQPILEHVKVRVTPYRFVCKEKWRKNVHSFSNFFFVPPLHRDLVELRGCIRSEFAAITRHMLVSHDLELVDSVVESWILVVATASKDMWWFRQKNPFPVKELMTSQRSRNLAWESIQDQTIRRLCFKTSKPLTSLHPTDREAYSSIPKPIFGFKVHRTRGDKDQWPNRNPT